MRQEKNKRTVKKNAETFADAFFPVVYAHLGVDTPDTKILQRLGDNPSSRSFSRIRSGQMIPMDKTLRVWLRAMDASEDEITDVLLAADHFRTIRRREQDNHSISLVKREAVAPPRTPAYEEEADAAEYQEDGQRVLDDRSFFRSLERGFDTSTMAGRLLWVLYCAHNNSLQEFEDKHRVGRDWYERLQSLGFVPGDEDSAETIANMLRDLKIAPQLALWIFARIVPDAPISQCIEEYRQGILHPGKCSSSKASGSLGS